MAFPIIPSGMFSGQGSTNAPNTNALGTISSAIYNPTQTNLANAYDGSLSSYADIQNGGVSLNALDPVGTVYSQPVIYSHSPASGAVASSFLNVVFKVSANMVVSSGIGSTALPPFIYLTINAAGNYSDTTPIASSSNPYYIFNEDPSSIQATLVAGSAYTKTFNQTCQIVFDGLSASKTLDVNSITLTASWNYKIVQFGPNSFYTSFGPCTGVFDLKIYDISYIYL